MSISSHSAFPLSIWMELYSELAILLGLVLLSEHTLPLSHLGVLPSAPG